MKTDIQIAKEVKMRPIVEVAKSIGIDEDDLELYGKYKAKVPLKYYKEKDLTNQNLCWFRPSPQLLQERERQRYQ